MPGGAVVVRAHGAEGAVALDEEGAQHPASFYCPISRQCMHDPVVLTDGHTYERRHIEKWLKEHHTSPVSGAELASKNTFPNHALRNAIEEYFEKILAGHRSAIQQTVARLRKGKRRFSGELLGTIDALMQCSVLVNADLSIERVLKSIMDQAKALVGAQVASVFLVDGNELYSTVNSTGGELRIPITSGIAGRVASSGAPLIVHDAYCDERFNAAVDEKTGFRTHSIMCLPIQHWKWGIIGVAQLINKKTGGLLAREERPMSREEQRKPQFTDDDQHFFQVLASQAAVAIVNSGFFDLEPRTRSKTSARPPSQVAGLWSSEAGPCPRKASTVPDKSRASKEHFAPVDKALLLPLLADAGSSWEVDTLALSEFTGGGALRTISGQLLREMGLVNYFALDEAKLACFLTEIESGYCADVPYHNSAHAASVVHFTHVLLSMGGAAKACANAAAPAVADPERRCKLVALASLVAAAVHDVDHAGLTNDFLVKSFSERARQFNDKSVNEQHHLSTAFDVLARPECNFLTGLPLAEFRLVRSLIIELVLATDMAEQGQIMGRIKELQQSDSEELTPKDAILLLKLTLKCADMGHLALSWNSHMRWVLRLEQEFFAQGDREKCSGLHDSVSFLMDRDKPGVSHTQVGFFGSVAVPMFQALARLLPSASPMLSAVEANQQRWQAIQAAAAAAESPQQVRT